MKGENSWEHTGLAKNERLPVSLCVLQCCVEHGG